MLAMVRWALRSIFFFDVLWDNKFYQIKWKCRGAFRIRFFFQSEFMAFAGKSSNHNGTFTLIEYEIQKRFWFHSAVWTSLLLIPVSDDYIRGPNTLPFSSPSKFRQRESGFYFCVRIPYFVQGYIILSALVIIGIF